MRLTGKLILGALAAVLVSIFIVPVLVTLAFLGTLLGAAFVAVAIWGVVLLGERWVDEGLGGYNYLDALDDAVQEVFQALRGLFAARSGPTFRQRLVAALPLLNERTKVTLAWPILIVLLIPVGIHAGLVHAIKEARRAAEITSERWSGAYL